MAKLKEKFLQALRNNEQLELTLDKSITIARKSAQKSFKPSIQ